MNFGDAVARYAARWLGLAALAILLAGCGSPTLAPTPAPTQPSSPESVASTIQELTPTPSDGVSLEPCSSGKLLIGDLPEIDAAWRAGIEAATARATEWQQDAVLSNLRVVCQIFEAEFRWQATFYSPDAQAFYSSDTGEVVPSGVEEELVPRLDVGRLSFQTLYDTLSEAGYGDDVEISPSSGVDIRLNTSDVPFGPPDAPDDVILYHVSLEWLGEIRDIFVDGTTGGIYQYAM